MLKFPNDFLNQLISHLKRTIKRKLYREIDKSRTCQYPCITSLHYCLTGRIFLRMCKIRLLKKNLIIDTVLYNISEHDERRPR